MAEFDQIFANDPNNPQSVAENGVVSIYAPGTRTLLSLRTVTGDPLSNPLRVNSRGFGPAFTVDGYTEVAWEAVAPGEVFSGTFKSYKGVLEEALAAKASARDAVTAVPLKIQEAVASGNFRGAPGTPGRDGSNVVPTAQAIATELTTKGSLANTALGAATASFTPARLFPTEYTPSEQIATLCDFGVGSRVWAVASDSTANDLADWLGTFLYLLKSELPAEVGLEHRTFNPATQAYQASPTTVKAGASSSAVGGVVMSDTFTRSGELVGSTSDNGKVWTGTVGAYAGNGSVATPTGAVGSLSFDAGSRDVILEANLNVVTTANAALPYMRFYLGCGTAALVDKGIWANLAINSGGNANLSVWKRFNNTNTQLVSTDFTIGLAANSASPQAFKVRVETSVQNITVTTTAGATVKTFTATMAEADSALMGTIAGVSSGPNATFATVDSVSMTTPYTPGSSSGLSVWNGAVGGATLQYQRDRLATMYNQPHIDVLVVSGGHNYATKTGPQFVAEVEGFVDAYRALHPESMILVSSQNPQKAPAQYVGAHAARQAALREWAKRKGYEYVPAFETFMAQPAGPDSLLQADGIHPTYPPNYTTEPSGSSLWARVFMGMVNARRIKGQPKLATP